MGVVWSLEKKLNTIITGVEGRTADIVAITQFADKICNDYKDEIRAQQLLIDSYRDTIERQTAIIARYRSQNKKHR